MIELCDQEGPAKQARLQGPACVLLLLLLLLLLHIYVSALIVNPTHRAEALLELLRAR
jgi:hypothetical protein